MLKKILAWLIQPSTVRGILVLCGATGVFASPEFADQIMLVVGSAYGLYEIIRNGNKAAPALVQSIAAQLPQRISTPYCPPPRPDVDKGTVGRVSEQGCATAEGQDPYVSRD